jgi:hypothetical protein
MTNGLSPRCWICGAVATTREHTTNKALIRIVCGEPQPGQPWFFHDDWDRNQTLQGLNSKRLAPYVDLCADCNNRRTRSHDAAVEQLVRWLIHRNPRLVSGNCIVPQAIYTQQTARGMLDLHLYFAKKFGCLVKQAHAVGKQLPLDLSAASKAIMTDTACPHLYLKFGCRPTDYPPIGRAKGDVYTDKAGHTFGLDWCHYYGPYAVQVLYVENALPDDPALVDAWHPRFGLPALKLLLIDKPILASSRWRSIFSAAKRALRRALNKITSVTNSIMRPRGL